MITLVMMVVVFLPYRLLSEKKKKALCLCLFFYLDALKKAFG